MKISKTLSLFAPLLLASAAMADYTPKIDQSQNQMQNQNQAQAQGSDKFQGMNEDVKQEAGTMSSASLKDNQQAKKTVGPQGVMIETSLMSAKAQLDGLRSQVSLAGNQTDANFINQVKSYNQVLDNRIREATNQTSNLKTTLVKKYPQVAMSDDTKNLDYSIKDLSSFFNSWNNKSTDRSYWADRDQAKADLDSLDRRLDKAIDQSKSFNANQFDISIG